VTSCTCCFGAVANEHFNKRIARRDLDRYRKNGPTATARLLRDLLVDAGALDGLLLDIGAGIGAVTFELLDRGVARAILVDASSSYLAAASEEAANRGRSDATQFVKGDFLDLAPELPVATVVTLIASSAAIRSTSVSSPWPWRMRLAGCDAIRSGRSCIPRSNDADHRARGLHTPGKTSDLAVVCRCLRKARFLTTRFISG